MRPRLAMPVIAFMAAGVVAVAGAGRASASPSSTPACATTAQSSAQTAPTPGNPCWTDVTPYPFGASGTAVDATSANCNLAISDNCYLSVESMAFRSWNRGLAVVAAGAVTPKSPYGVWLYNGSRWFPDPTFPGTSTCQGTQILWAGKLDYWLVGGPGGSNWPSLCRFDGVNFDWEPLAVPKSALAEVPQVQVPGSTNYVPAPGAINAGACLSWDNCWFFGSYGVVLHWDGQSLTNASGDLASSPWLDAGYSAAIVRTDAAGNAFGFVVGGAPGVTQPDGAPAPQLFGSAGGAFGPLGFTPPTDPLPGDPYRTDLTAVDFDSAGEGWVAGGPAGAPPGETASPTQEPAPLVRISTAGTAVPCPGTAADAFMAATYTWTSIGVFPGGDAVAGGTVEGPFGAEPVLDRVSCNSAEPPAETTFRVPDPTYPDPTTAPLIPADEGASIAGLAVNATNDAWAAATASPSGVPNPSGTNINQPPHLYHWTDTQTPLAPAGNDIEPRPLVLTQEPSIFVLAPPTVITPVITTRTTTKRGKVKRKKEKLRAPIYDFSSRLGSKHANGTFTLDISFKVRYPIRFGLEALDHQAVVSATGLHTFKKGTRGQLALQLDPKHWPTKIAVVQPKHKQK